MAEDDLRRDSLREALKAKGRSRRKAAVRHAEAEKAGWRSGRNDILPSLRIEPCPIDALKSHVRKLRKNDPAHVREIANSQAHSLQCRGDGRRGFPDRAIQ